jgi:hypothetical protein
MLALHLLQSALVHINTLLLQRVLDDPDWAGRLTDADRRGLTPLFWSNVNPYGRFTLDMDTHLGLGLAQAAAPTAWATRPRACIRYGQRPFSTLPGRTGSGGTAASLPRAPADVVASREHARCRGGADGHAPTHPHDPPGRRADRRRGGAGPASPTATSGFAERAADAAARNNPDDDDLEPSEQRGQT